MVDQLCCQTSNNTESETIFIGVAMDCGPIFNHLPLFHCEASCLNVAMKWGPT